MVKGEEGAEIGCCVALTDDKEALIVVSKREKPRMVRGMLLKGAKEAGIAVNMQTLRFGYASLLPDDEGVLLIKVNKGPTEGPLPLAVKRRTKLAGFKEVVFSIDESLEHEGEDLGGAAPPREAGVTAEQLRAAMERLTPSIKAAMGTSIELQKGLMAASRSFVALLKGDDLAGAHHSLEDIVRLVKQAHPGAGGAGNESGFRQAHSAWLAAISVVDAQLAALARQLIAEDDAELKEIAEYGLNAVTGDLKVPLMAALVEVGGGTAEGLAKAGPKALEAAQAFRAHIESDEQVEACDENPFGVAVSIRATLGPALAALEASLSPR